MNKKDYEERYLNMLRTYGDVRDAFIEANGTDKQDYWQGKKDGIRIALAELAPDEKDRQRWEKLQDSSPGGYASDKEKALALVGDAYRIFNMLKDDHIKYYSQEAIRWLAWLRGTELKVESE